MNKIIAKQDKNHPIKMIIIILRLFCVWIATYVVRQFSDNCENNNFIIGMIKISKSIIPTIILTTISIIPTKIIDKYDESANNQRAILFFLSCPEHKFILLFLILYSNLVKIRFLYAKYLCNRYYLLFLAKFQIF